MDDERERSGADDDRVVLARAGQLLRSRRRARGLSLAALADATGISASTLSRLETGALRPTLEQLLPLARVHGVPLEELVGAPATGDPRIHPRPVRRHGRVFLPLVGRPGGMQAYKVLIPPASIGEPAAPRRHAGGDEWLYVLHGRVGVLADGAEHELAAGDSVQFDTRRPHRIENLDRDAAAEVLFLLDPRSERAHVGAAATQRSLRQAPS